MIHKQYLVPHPETKAMPADLRLPAGEGLFPVIVFVHGFKAFKDWGHFNALADALCTGGFAVFKFSFSHGGTTVAQPEDFADLEAFGRNTFSKELDDLGLAIDWLFGECPQRDRLVLSKLSLIGHSRGGGIAILKAAEDARVKKLLTWAAVSDFEPRVNPPDLARWQQEGVQWIPNARTGQQMPMYYSIRDDFYAHRERLDIPAAASRITIPWLIIHGAADESVPLREGEALHARNEKSVFRVIANATHTFGGKHPFTETELPAHSQALLRETMDFLKTE